MLPFLNLLLPLSDHCLLVSIYGTQKPFVSCHFSFNILSFAYCFPCITAMMCRGGFVGNGHFLGQNLYRVGSSSAELGCEVDLNSIEFSCRPCVSILSSRCSTPFCCYESNEALLMCTAPCFEVCVWCALPCCNNHCLIDALEIGPQYLSRHSMHNLVCLSFSHFHLSLCLSLFPPSVPVLVPPSPVPLSSPLVSAYMTVSQSILSSRSAQRLVSFYF
jgi:hypothetical protein